jgi:hypothetical protein
MVARGLFRLWVVMLFIWIALLSLDPASLRFDPSVIFDHPLPFIVPPAVVLAIGAGLVWAFRGFR